LPGAGLTTSGVVTLVGIQWGLFLSTSRYSAPFSSAVAGIRILSRHRRRHGFNLSAARAGGVVALSTRSHPLRAILVSYMLLRSRLCTRSNTHRPPHSGATTFYALDELKAGRRCLGLPATPPRAGAGSTENKPAMSLLFQTSGCGRATARPSQYEIHFSRLRRICAVQLCSISANCFSLLMFAAAASIPRRQWNGHVVRFDDARRSISTDLMIDMGVILFSLL